MKLPLLYSFRRCPYAMRARFALAYAGISCVVREVDLKNKPRELIKLSPKGTVPVLLLPNGEMLDESIEIVSWALQQIGEDNLSPELETKAQAIIHFNDTVFTKIVHCYKYRDNYPAKDFVANEENLYCHLESLNERLRSKPFLLSGFMSKADIAVFPFVRQAVQIHPEQFDRPSLTHLLEWLKRFLQSDYFMHAMHKYPVWASGDDDTIF